MAIRAGHGSGAQARAAHRLSSTPGDSTLFCCYAVDDLAAARAAITDGGGTIGDVEQFDFGTVLTAADSQGRRFGVVVAAPGEPRPALNGSGPGDLSYITYETPESAGLRSFYGRVLSWTFDAGRISDGWAVRDSHPMAGAAGGCDAPVTVPMWTVTDIDAAVARVGEAGVRSSTRRRNRRTGSPRCAPTIKAPGSISARSERQNGGSSRPGCDPMARDPELPGWRRRLLRGLVCCVRVRL